MALALLTGYLLFVQQSVRFSIICFGTILILTVSLVTYLNRTNRNIRFFFDSVKNNDSNLSFSVEKKSRSLRELHQSINNVNRQIQDLKIENAQQEQYFQKILEHLATGIITYYNKGFILHANSAAKRLLSLDVLTHIRQIERVDKKLFMIIEDMKPFERHLVAVDTKQGEIQLSLKSTSFGNEDNELVILSIQDIKHELDEKEVDSWMKLIRVLMHEIMNSITPITSLSESLFNIYQHAEVPVSPQEMTESSIATTLNGLRVIKEQGRGLMEFVESYRKLTRIPKPELRNFRISDFFARVTVLINSLEKGNNITITFRTDNPEMEVFADENLISLVLINLVKNAVEANEKNPECKIEILAGIDSNDKPEICVSDNGPGISKENLTEIFIPFFTTRTNGSGIGLSISKQIMSAHGGTLKVRSVENRETKFCMKFQK